MPDVVMGAVIFAIDAIFGAGLVTAGKWLY